MKTTQANLQILIDAAATSLQVLINNEMIEYKEKFKRPMSARMIEILELNFLYKIVFTFATYIRESDIVTGVKTLARSETIVFDCTITRDGVDYFMSTEQIIAGGYNIQCAHLRYIVKTKLPAIKSPSAARAIQDRINGIKKIDRLYDEMSKLIQWRDRDINKIHADRLMSEQDVINNSWFKESQHRIYGDLPEGAKANYDNSREVFDANRANKIKDILETHARLCSASAERAVLSRFDKDAFRVQKKIDKIIL